MSVYNVQELKHIDVTRYKEGDVFLSQKQIGIIQSGTVEVLMRQSDLKEYVKKKDVKKMIDDTLKKVSE